MEIAKDLSEKFGEIYDLELAKELTEIYEDLGWCVLKIFEKVLKTEKERNEKLARLEVELEKEKIVSEERYRDLVKKLAKCKKERDEKKHAREQAEYDKEYFAKELAKRYEM